MGGPNPRLTVRSMSGDATVSRRLTWRQRTRDAHGDGRRDRVRDSEWRIGGPSWPVNTGSESLRAGGMGYIGFV
jgi:hypothetical protein